MAQPKRVGLLAYLLLARPIGFRQRDSLLALFWPELDEERARHGLRQALYAMRKTLGREVIVSRGRDEVAIDPRAVDCDALELEAALDAGRTARAARLYGGDFLAGFFISDASSEFEHWLEQERARLRKRMVSAVRDVVRREQEAERLGAAIRWLRWGTSVDPTDEDLVRRLIEALDRSGDRAGAVSTYQAFARRTRRHLRVSPAPETQALVRRVRERQDPQRKPRPLQVRPLPLPPTPLIGREGEIATVLDLLRQEFPHLLTLTGPAGGGKTRLALEAATRAAPLFPDGVCYVSLSSVRRADRMAPAILEALGLQADRKRSAVERLATALANRSILLVLDNFEHLLPAAAAVGHLLASAARVRILATSRAPLRLRAEHLFRVAPLATPPDRLAWTPQRALAFDSVALFVDRAERVRPGFSITPENVHAIAEICRRLDGLPLAIELAAARVRMLTPARIAERLEDRFALLKGGPVDAPERHRELEETIAWSHELLGPREAELFQCIAHFVGGVEIGTLETIWSQRGKPAAEVVDRLASLVDESLVVEQADSRSGSRFTMLETIREFGLRVAASRRGGEDWPARVETFFLDLVESGQCRNCTPDQGAWFDRLDLEHENLLAVLGRALERRDGSTAIRVGASLWWYWWVRGHLAEGRRSLERALALEESAADPATTAHALLGAGMLASAQGDHETAVARLERSLALARETGDESAVSVALQNLGFVHRERGDLEAAEAVFEQVLERSRASGSLHRMANALDGIGTIALQGGRLERARECLEQSLALARRLGDEHRLSRSTANLASLARLQGDFARAALLYEDSLAICRRLSETLGIAVALAGLADLARRAGACERARELYAEALGLYRESQSYSGLATTLTGFAALSADQNRADRAARLCGAVDALLESTRTTLPPPDLALRESVSRRTRCALGDAGEAERRSRGRRMSLDEAIVLALQLAQPAAPTAGTARMAGTARPARSG